MPELPEVTTVINILKKNILQNKIKNVSIYWDNMINGDCDSFCQNVVGKEIVDIKRHGKYIIFHLTKGYIVSHLRMEGKYYLLNYVKPYDKHTHIVFELENQMFMHYHDVRKFGKFCYEEKLPLKSLSKIGMDCLDEKYTKQYLYEKLKSKQKSIKECLLDQSIAAGVGNIYADEILFLSKIHPLTKANSLSLKKCGEIVANSKKVLTRAIELGGTTIRSYTSSLNVDGRFQIELLAYNRKGQPCYHCQTIIEKIKLKGRGTCYCPKCQKRK